MWQWSSFKEKWHGCDFCLFKLHLICQSCLLSLIIIVFVDRDSSKLVVIEVEKMENKFKIGLNSTWLLPANASNNSLKCQLEYAYLEKKNKITFWHACYIPLSMFFYKLNKVKFSLALQSRKSNFILLYSLKYWRPEKVINASMCF